MALTMADISKDIEEELTCELLPAAQLLLTRLVITITKIRITCGQTSAKL